MIGADWTARLAATYLLVGSIIPACAASKLYVTNSGGDDITVIDGGGSGFQAVGAIKVGEHVHGICAPAGTDRLFATVESDNSLKVIDAKSDHIIDVIQLGGPPNQCASTPDGQTSPFRNTPRTKSRSRICRKRGSSRCLEFRTRIIVSMRSAIRRCFVPPSTCTTSIA